MVVDQANFFYGFRFDFEDKWYVDFTTEVAEVNAVTNSGFLADAIPILGYLPNPRVNRLKKLIRKWFDYLDIVMKEHRENFDPGSLV